MDLFVARGGLRCCSGSLRRLSQAMFEQRHEVFLAREVVELFDVKSIGATEHGCIDVGLGNSDDGVQSRDGSGRVGAWLLGSWMSVASIKMHANVYNFS